ncbi:MAG: hypothetical protein ACM3O3_12810 [Syntrophothermus sp.]
MDFYVPTYLESDFDDSLNVNGQDCILNYNAATPTSIKVNINSLDFKSNMKGISDTNFAIQVSLSSGIHKGDYLTDEANNTYLINWFPATFINCLESQIQLCSITLDIERFHNITYDSDGNSSTPNYYETIVNDIKGYYSRFGMGLYDTNSGQIGIPATQKIIVGIQYNATTALVQISDEFTLNDTQFVITDIDYSQIDSATTYGILTLQAQVLEGGRRA